MSNSAHWQSMLVMVFDGLGLALFKASQTYLIEQGACQEFYYHNDPSVLRPDGSVPEAMCKTKELQSKVAHLSSMFNLSFSIIGFLASPVYTRLAPIIGKRTILLINSTSLVLRTISFFAVFYLHNSFISVNWILALWAFDLIGGGVTVREILLWAYIAESISGDGLTGTFNLLSAFLIGMMSVGTFLGALLLKFDVWLLCLVNIGVAFLNLLTIVLLPRDEKFALDHQNNEEEARLMPAQTNSSADCHTDGSAHHDSSLSEILVRAITVDLPLSLKLLIETVQDPFTRQVAIIFFTYTLALTVSGTTQQWTSSTFHWALADVDQITSMEQIISAITLLILPILTHHVLRPYLRVKQLIDYQIIVSSLIISAAGAFIMAVAPSITVYIFGVSFSALSVGLSDSLRSFATTALKNDEAIEKLYLSIRTMQSLAGIVGLPLWADIFLLILNSDGALPPGLLFVGTGAVFLVSLYFARYLRYYIYGMSHSEMETAA